jgi:hypothetical protein
VNTYTALLSLLSASHNSCEPHGVVPPDDVTVLLSFDIGIISYNLNIAEFIQRIAVYSKAALTDDYVANELNDTLTAIQIEPTADGVTVTISVKVTHFSFYTVALQKPHLGKQRFLKLYYRRDKFKKYSAETPASGSIHMHGESNYAKVGNFTSTELSFEYRNTVPTTKKQSKKALKKYIASRKNNLIVKFTTGVPICINTTWYHAVTTRTSHTEVAMHALSLPEFSEVDLQVHTTDLGSGGLTQTIIVYTATADNSIPYGAKVCKYHTTDVEAGQLLLIYPCMLEVKSADYFEFSIAQLSSHLPSLLYAIVIQKCPIYPFYTESTVRDMITSGIITSVKRSSSSRSVVTLNAVVTGVVYAAVIIALVTWYAKHHDAIGM